MKPGPHTAADAAGILTVIAMTGAMWFIGVRPVVEARAGEARAQARRAELERDLASATAEADAAAALAADFEQRLAGITHTPRPAGELNARLAELVEIAAAADLEIDRLTPGAIARSAFSDDVPIDLSGRTTPAGVPAFLATLHERAPDVAVRSISVGAADPQRVTLRVGMVWRAAQTDKPAPASAGGG